MHPPSVEGEVCYGWVGVVNGGYFFAGGVGVCGLRVVRRGGVVLG